LLKKNPGQALSLGRGCAPCGMSLFPPHPESTPHRVTFALPFRAEICCRRDATSTTKSPATGLTGKGPGAPTGHRMRGESQNDELMSLKKKNMLIPTTTRPRIPIQKPKREASRTSDFFSLWDMLVSRAQLWRLRRKSSLGGAFFEGQVFGRAEAEGSDEGGLGSNSAIASRNAFALSSSEASRSHWAAKLEKCSRASGEVACSARCLQFAACLRHS
jgi:hypothetical protein